MKGRRLVRNDEAGLAYQAAIALTANEAERAFLDKQRLTMGGPD